jgi:hypothetical protein
MDRMADVDAVKKSRISAFVENRTSIPGRSSRSLVIILTELTQISDDFKDVFY